MEQHELDNNVLQAMERYEVLVRDNPAGVCGVAPDGTFFEVNESYAQLLGFTATELVGQHINAVLFPEDQPARLERLNYRVHNWNPDTVTVRLRHKVGYGIHCLIHSIPIIIQETYQGFYCVVADVRYREQLKAALDAFHTSLQHAQKLENIANWAVSLNAGSIIGSETFYRMIGCSDIEHGVPIQSFVNLVDPADRELLHYTFCLNAEHHGPVDVEFRLRRMIDNSLRLFHATGERVKNSHGEALYIVGVIRDVTEQRETEDYIRRSQNLSVAGQLAAGVAHEIRNPLTAVKGFLQLMPSIGDPTKAIALMLNELSRIEQIVNELLVLAKPQPENFTYEHVGHRIQEVMQLLSAQAILDNVVVHIEIDDDLPQIECEMNHLKQVFINLLKNGMEAMPKGGHIVVRVARLNDQEIFISIEDAGQGMTEDQLSKLGEPFFTTKERGTGLGWMISQRIIQNHRGTLHVSSQVGKGTKVTIRLPIVHTPTFDQINV